MCAQVKLVVLDSVTFHFRQNFTDMPLRTRVLADMGQKLMQLAAMRDVAVRFLGNVALRALSSWGLGVMQREAHAAGRRAGCCGARNAFSGSQNLVQKLMKRMSALRGSGQPPARCVGAAAHEASLAARGWKPLSRIWQAA